MGKRMIQVTAPKAENNKMSLVADVSKAKGKSRGVLFRCNAHTDKKKEARKKACRGRVDW
jgi:hypothetical protein